MTNNVTFIEKGDGPPLIFLHGIGATAKGWQYQVDAFAADYRPIALDLPGYGGSTILSEMTFPNLTQWLHEFIATHNLEHPILIGTSFGGMIVQTYLAMYPDQTRAAVLTGTSPAFGRKDGDWQKKFVKARLDPLDAGNTMADLAPEMVKNLVGSGAAAAGVALAQQDIGSVSNDTFRAAVLCLVDFDQRENLGKINIPCLLLVGEEDKNAPPPMMEKMASKITNAQFEMLPRLGHLAHLEEPTMFNKVLKDFLDTVQ